jgi:DNA-binding transcriptional ArsR family regulator
VPLLDRFDWPLLDSLEGPLGWIPDFLTPYPETNVPRFADELATLRRTTPSRVRQDIHAAYVDVDGVPGELPATLAERLRRPAALRGAIADALQSYWDLLIEPYWPRLRDVLDNDIQFRARQLAAEGAGRLFRGLHRNLRWHDERLEVEAAGLNATSDVDGRGLILTPSVFENSINTMIDEHLPPVLCYAARGRAGLWSAARPPGAELAALLGGTRAALLTELGEPATTSQLALRLGLTPGGVSQHLRVLLDSGLLRRSRNGRVVIYQRTAVGHHLVKASRRS